jgi:hypothetical protein
MFINIENALQALESWRHRYIHGFPQLISGIPVTNITWALRFNWYAVCDKQVTRGTFNILGEFWYNIYNFCLQQECEIIMVMITEALYEVLLV